MVDLKTRIKFKQAPPPPPPRSKPARAPIGLGALDKTRVWVVDSNVASFDHVRAALVQDGYDLLLFRTAEEAIREAERRPPDLALVCKTLAGMDGLALVKSWRQNDVTRAMPILMLSPTGEIADKVAGFEAGADDYVVTPFQAPELAYRVRSLLVRSRAAAPAETKRKGRIITVFGTKGGVGKTTVAVNLALTLQRRTRARIILIDADFYFGDVPLHLNLNPSSTMMELIQRIDQLEPDLVERVVVSHPSGIYILPAPTRPEQAESITPDQFRKLLGALSELYDFVLVDCSPNYEERNLQILDQSDEILFVVRPELGPLRNMGIFMDLGYKLGLPSEKIHVVLNRAGNHSGIEAAQIEKSFRTKVEFRLVEGGREVASAVNRGVPLALCKPRHAISKQIVVMADYLARQRMGQQ